MCASCAPACSVCGIVSAVSSVIVYMYEAPYVFCVAVDPLSSETLCIHSYTCGLEGGV